MIPQGPTVSPDQGTPAFSPAAPVAPAFEGPFEGCGVKLARAYEHMTTLKAERARFLHDEGRRVVGQLDPETGDCVFRVSGDPPPLWWGGVVSEWAHAVRSLLDNLIWTSVELRGGAPGDHTHYPIPRMHRLRGPDFGKHESNFITEARSAVEGVSQDDLAFIEETSPYEFGPDWAQWHPLALLHHLSNVDKHRFIHVGAAACAAQLVWPARHPTLWGQPFHLAVPQQFRWNQKIKGVNLFPSLVRADTGAPVLGDVSMSIGWDFGGGDDRTQILRVSFPEGAPRPYPEMKMEPDPALDIAFSYEGGPIYGASPVPISIWDLMDMHNAVAEILAYFADPRPGRFWSAGTGFPPPHEIARLAAEQAAARASTERQ